MIVLGQVIFVNRSKNRERLFAGFRHPILSDIKYPDFSFTLICLQMDSPFESGKRCHRRGKNIAKISEVNRI